ncbi:hypothetical protein [Luteimonas wenzhouensis]|uniref:Uncharacterized protein n=1 Tax=Luteimonas wenzhouensis TaxID=2599615 RepID=A0A5C5U432_9GAMM|nr:hypothetical protein [Luteimonas wenzhouensis]TWT20726.1 hypothetical protein FQY79_05275 [Luteimonas wenzhouensis]
MSIRRLLFLYIAALLPLPALAQAPATCPELPASSGLSWESTQGDDFLFCKAVREDGFQAFSVMLREESTFRERFGLREEKGVIDGHKVRWYRGQLPNRDAIVRETLIELDDGLTAHIMLRVEDERQLADSLRLAGMLRFNDTRVGSN